MESTGEKWKEIGNSRRQNKEEKEEYWK